MAKRKKLVEVSGLAKNLKENLKRALVKSKDYDKVTVKKNTHRKLKPKSKARKRPLDEVRKEFKELEKLSMARVKLLRQSNRLKQSFAYQKAKESQPNTGKYRRHLFDISDTKSYKDIQREIGRMKEFLNDMTSTPEGVDWSLKELEIVKKYGGAFGNQWKAQTGLTYDPSRIDAEYLRTAGKIYRMMEDVKGAYGLVYDEGGYESDTTFASIYDMVVKRNILLDENGNPLDRRMQERAEDTLMDILTKLVEYKNNWSEQARQERELGNTDSPSLRALDEYNTARDFLVNLHKI